MGQGIQQPTVQQAGGSNAVLDLVKVLYEPAAVFERIRERPKFLLPFLTLLAVQLVFFIINMDYFKAGIAAQMAAQGAPAGAGPSLTVIAWISAFAVLLIIGLALLVGGLLLWMLVAIFGGDGKFRTLLSVSTYASVPTLVLLTIVGTVVIHMQGISQITSPQDMQPALGLDLLAPGTKGFLGAALKAVNPFSIWGLVLTAIGVSVTHRLSQGTGYAIATISFLIGLCIAGVFASFGGR